MSENSIRELLETGTGVDMATLETAKWADFFWTKPPAWKVQPAKYALLIEGVIKLGVESGKILPICDTTTLWLLRHEIPEGLAKTHQRITDVLYQAWEKPNIVLKNLWLSREIIKSNPTLLPKRNRTPSMISYLLFWNVRPLDAMNAPVEPEWQKICEEWIIDFQPSTIHLGKYFGYILQNLFHRDAPSLIWNTLIKPKIETKDPEVLTFLEQKGGSELFFSFSSNRIQTIIDNYYPEVPTQLNQQGFWKQYAEQHPDAAYIAIQTYLAELSEQDVGHKKAQQIKWVLQCLASTSPSMADKVYTLLKDYEPSVLISNENGLYFVMAECYDRSNNTITWASIESIIWSFIDSGWTIDEIWWVFWQLMVWVKRKSQWLALLKRLIESENDVAYLASTSMTPTTYQWRELLIEYPELIKHAATIVPETNWGKYPVFFEKLIVQKEEETVEEPEDIGNVVL